MSTSQLDAAQAQPEPPRSALAAAADALARLGFTPQAFAATSEEERASPVWRDVLQVWEALGVPYPTPRCILRYSRGARRGERAYFSPDAALAAAIDALELNESFPECIEVNGTRLMDSAAILRAWEDRHDPG